MDTKKIIAALEAAGNVLEEHVQYDNDDEESLETEAMNLCKEALAGIQKSSKDDSLLLNTLKELCDAMHPHVMKMNIREGFHEHNVLAQARKVLHENGVK